MSKARDLANAGTALTTVSATELGYLDGVTSAVQTQIDSKIGQATAINPTIVDAKGDIIAATATDTVARLAVGSNDQVLTADSSTATGLKWATPAAGGMTLLSTTTMSGTSVTISSINQTYNKIYGILTNATWASGTNLIYCAPNNDTGGTVQININDIGSVSANNITYWRLATQSVDSGSNAVAFEIENYSQATKKPLRSWGGWVVGGNYKQNTSSGFFQSDTAITSLVFTNNNGVSFTGGTIKLYGVK